MGCRTRPVKVGKGSSGVRVTRGRGVVATSHQALGRPQNSQQHRQPHLQHFFHIVAFGCPAQALACAIAHRRDGCLQAAAASGGRNLGERRGSAPLLTHGWHNSSTRDTAGSCAGRDGRARCHRPLSTAAACPPILRPCCGVMWGQQRAQMERRKVRGCRGGTGLQRERVVMPGARSIASCRLAEEARRTPPPAPALCPLTPRLPLRAKFNV